MRIEKWITGRAVPRSWLVGRWSVAVWFALTAGRAVLAEDDPEYPYAMVAAANEAFAEERFDEALVGYEGAAVKLGESAELDYNRAAALYKLGRNEEAANLFAKAAMSDQPGLRRRAKFNWGNCDYAGVLEALEQASPESGQQPDLPQAIEKLESAMRHYRDAVETEGDAPSKGAVERASRGNIERAQNMIDTIKEMMEQQEQQQQQQNQDQQQDQEQDQENQQQDQSQQDDQQDQQQDQQQQDQNQEGEQQEKQQQDQQQQQENQEQADEQQSEKQDPKEQEQPQPDPNQQREMTPQEADALLQAVRDKEKQRREEKMRKMRARRVPVVRDW
ncbi:MAG: hypothetical protein GY778_18445 [bacterium]|nr:hypothetical protein [bacterium]